MLCEERVPSLTESLNQRAQSPVSAIARRHQRVAHESLVASATQRGASRRFPPIRFIEGKDPTQFRFHPTRVRTKSFTQTQRIRPFSFVRFAIPGADILADVTAKHPVPLSFPQPDRDRFARFDRRV